MLKLYTFLLLAILLLVHPELHAQDTLQLREYACLAFNPQTFKDCLKEVRNTGVPIIRLTAPIVCESRQDCTFEYNYSNRSFKISPLSSEFKFVRRNDFGYTLFNADNVENMNIVGVSFVDEGDSPCPEGTTCPPLLSIKNSTNILLNQVVFLGTHGTSISITDSRKVTIANSIFQDSFKTGIEVSTKDFTEGLKIENNTFEDNSGTALVYQAKSIGGNESGINKNQFINNHSKGAYSNCVYPCTGAQIKIIGPTSNLRVAQNVVSGGVNSAFDSLGLYASGIEVGGRDIQSTTLYCNEVSANRGSGIVQSGPFVNLSGISVTENKIWNNGLNLNIPTVTADENNCYTAECKLACATN